MREYTEVGAYSGPLVEVAAPEPAPAEPAPGVILRRGVLLRTGVVVVLVVVGSVVVADGFRMILLALGGVDTLRVAEETRI